MSPDGESIVTCAGDERLRFWNVFTKARLLMVCCLPYSLEEMHASCKIYIVLSLHYRNL
jgi:WD40 repeat protein